MQTTQVPATPGTPAVISDITQDLYLGGYLQFFKFPNSNEPKEKLPLCDQISLKMTKTQMEKLINSWIKRREYDLE